MWKIRRHRLKSIIFLGWTYRRRPMTLLKLDFKWNKKRPSSPEYNSVGLDEVKTSLPVYFQQKAVILYN